MKIELAIKFGSNEIIVYRKGLGIVARKSSYVAINKKGKICAYGDDAKKLCDIKSAQYDLCEPLQGIEVKDNNLAIALLKNIIDEAIFENGIISALVAVPCALTEKKLLELKLLLHSAGVSKISFVQNAVCVRLGLDVNDEAQIMVVDMGKYLVDISILTRYQFISGRNYLIGGAEMDVALATYIEDNFGVKISLEQAQNIKNELASMYNNDMYTVTFKGVDANNEYKEITMRASEARVAVVGIYEKIFDLIEETLENLPSESLAEINQNGIVFTGGVSCIYGLMEYATQRFKMPIKVVENPKDAVVLGAGKLLSLNKNDYPHIVL